MQSEVWLIRDRTNPFPVKGTMCLDDGRAKISVDGGADCAAVMREYLEEQTGIADLATRLQQGEEVQVLEFSPGEAKVSFPKSSAGYIAEVEVDHKRWYIAMASPSGGAIENLRSIRKGRKLAKEWKAALS